MSDSDVRAISLFFYFVFLDDRKAQEAAGIATDLFLKRSKKIGNSPTGSLIVSCTNQVWQKMRTKIVRGRPTLSGETGWHPPQGLSLAPWREFQKAAPEEELIALTWSRILRIPDSEIAKGLETSVGTVRYRVGKGLHHLGELSRSTLARGMKS